MLAEDEVSDPVPRARQTRSICLLVSSSGSSKNQSQRDGEETDLGFTFHFSGLPVTGGVPLKEI